MCGNFILPETGKPCLLFYALFNLRNLLYLIPFEKGLNVVTSIDNHVGKSSLLKSLYYTLGAKVDFDSVWDRRSKLYVVTLSVDETEYCIARFMKRFAVFKGKTLLKITDSVTQELAPLLGDIFDFSVYLPNKDTGKVEMAPLAFTFMPYYIDQDKGWSGLYDSFASITQYKSADRIRAYLKTKYSCAISTKSKWKQDGQKQERTQQAYHSV